MGGELQRGGKVQRGGMSWVILLPRGKCLTLKRLVVAKRLTNACVALFSGFF